MNTPTAPLPPLTFGLTGIMDSPGARLLNASGGPQIVATIDGWADIEAKAIALRNFDVSPAPVVDESHNAIARRLLDGTTTDKLIAAIHRVDDTIATAERLAQIRRLAATELAALTERWIAEHGTDIAGKITAALADVLDDGRSLAESFAGATTVLRARVTARSEPVRG